MIAAPEAPRAFKNNLVQGDRVLYVPTNRFGKVNWSPRKPDQRMTAVVFEGTKAPQYFDVMLLRLDPNGDGKPEQEPPIDGTPTAPSASEPSTGNPRIHPLPPLLPAIPGLSELKRARDDLDVQVRSIMDRHATLKAQRERLAQAIEILEPSKKPIEVPRIS